MRKSQGRDLRAAEFVGALLLFTGCVVAQAEDIVVGEKPAGWVERALFTSAVADREPVDTVVVVDAGQQEVTFFTELRQLAGRTVTHRWEYAGEVVAEVPFEVGGPRWRVHSRKTLLPTQAGRWSAVVVDESGWVLHAEMFEYRP
jgi:hypothetical protein